MIMAMVNIDELRQSILIVVIETGNIERMKKADPVTIESNRHGGILEAPRYPDDFSVLIAYEENQDELYQKAKGDPATFLKWLERGRVFIQGVDGKENVIKITRTAYDK